MSQGKQSKLSQSTINRRESLLNKAINSNKTFDDLSKLNKQDYKKAMNIKGKFTNDSWKSQLRLMNSIQKTPELYIKEHVKKRGGTNTKINLAIRKEANRIITKQKGVSAKTTTSKYGKIKVGSYRITKVDTELGGYKYITWHTKKEFEKILAKLKRSYGKTVILSTGTTHIKRKFESKEMKALIKQLKITELY